MGQLQRWTSAANRGNCFLSYRGAWRYNQVPWHSARGPTMGVIESEEAAKRLARVIVSDIEIYNKDKFHTGADLTAAIEEGRALFRSRVAPELVPVFTSVLEDRRASRKRAAAAAAGGRAGRGAEAQRRAGARGAAREGRAARRREGRSPRAGRPRSTARRRGARARRGCARARVSRRSRAGRRRRCCPRRSRPRPQPAAAPIAETAGAHGRPGGARRRRVAGSSTPRRRPRAWRA